MGAASAPAVDDEIAVGAGDDVIEFKNEIGEGGEIHGHGLAGAIFAVDGSGEGVVIPDVGVVEVGAVGIEIAGIESGEGVVDEFDVFLFSHWLVSFRWVRRVVAIRSLIGCLGFGKPHP